MRWSINSLYNYFKNNKFDDLDNFTKKAIEKKFFSTAGILKTKALEGSRIEQITLSKDVDEESTINLLWSGVWMERKTLF